MSNNQCSSGHQQESQVQSTTDIKQATPFNLNEFSILFVFCIIIALTSSLYYNWPAVERILIDDKVFQNLCTKDEILNAIDGMFVCDKQRVEIGNLALVIFYSEFVAFAIGGILADYKGVYVVLILGFIFGFTGFTLLYFNHLSNGLIKVAFALWGLFGGFVFITSIQFPKMFPQSKSLADGMIVLFDNLSGLMTLVIHKIMKCFDLRYHEAFATYILWGIFPAFLLSLSFMPSVIISNKTKEDELSFNCLGKNLSNYELWPNFIVFSIPVTCSIFYKKTFSTYFLKNQTLVRLFPIIMLFVFVPTIFIAALNQFMGVHITSTILYIFYIISFVCFLYPTKQYGLLSIILFVISTSAAEQQTMTYISEQHPQNESTLLGISYAVDFLVGSILQRLFTCIFNRKPKAILFVIVPLFLICIAYSLYCQFGNNKQNEEKKNKKVSFKAIFFILWIVPFLFLCIAIIIKNVYTKEMASSEITERTLNYNYENQKTITMSTIFYSFSFYYVCNIFLVLVSIFKISRNLKGYENKILPLLIFVLSYFIIPQCLAILFNIIRDIESNVLTLTILLLVFKIMLYFLSNSIFYKISEIMLFSLFLIIYGFVFFLFIYMLAYYNLQIAFSTKNSTTLLHWGAMLAVFVIFRIFHSIISEFDMGFSILWMFNLCSLLFLTIILCLYIHYEKEIPFSINSSSLEVTKFGGFENIRYDNHSHYNIVFNLAMTVCNFGILIHLTMGKFIFRILYVVLIIQLCNLVYLIIDIKFVDENTRKYLDIGVTSLSLLLFIIVLFSKIYIKDRNYENKFISTITFLNFIVSTMSSNLCWNSIECKLKEDFEKGINVLSFCLGNLLGWLLFIIYIAVSKSQIIYNSFK